MRTRARARDRCLASDAAARIRRFRADARAVVVVLEEQLREARLEDDGEQRPGDERDDARAERARHRD